MNAEGEKILPMWADLKIKYFSVFQQAAFSTSLKSKNDG